MKRDFVNINIVQMAVCGNTCWIRMARQAYQITPQKEYFYFEVQLNNDSLFIKNCWLVTLKNLIFQRIICTYSFY